MNRSLVGGLALAASSILTAACGSDSVDPGAAGTVTSSQSSGTTGAGAGESSGGGMNASGGAGGAPEEPRSEACVALDAKLQAALDSARAATTCKETTLAVQTPDCALMTYVSADDSATPLDHHYRIASNTKTFTAGVILKLVAEGAIGLDELASEVLPTINGLDGMTIRQILSHSAGLYNYTSDDDFINTKATEPQKKWTPEELIAIAEQHGPYFAPGTSYHYSNTDYIVAGLIAEKVGRKKISAQIRELLLTPSDLDAIYFDGEESEQGVLAQGYDDEGNDVTMKFDPSWIWAAGAMVATAADLSRWMERLGSGGVHVPAIQAELEQGVQTGQDGMTYGLGVFLLDASYGGGAGRSIGHIGSVYGYHSQAFYYPDTNITITGFVTCEDADPNDIRIGALTTLFP